MSMSKVPICPLEVKSIDAVPYWEDPDYIRRLSNVHVQALELLEGEREAREEEACRQRQKQRENWKVFEGMLGKDPRSFFRRPVPARSASPCSIDLLLAAHRTSAQTGCPGHRTEED